MVQRQLIGQFAVERIKWAIIDYPRNYGVSNGRHREPLKCPFNAFNVQRQVIILRHFRTSRRQIFDVCERGWKLTT